MAVFAIIVITIAMCVNSSRRKSRLQSAGGGKFTKFMKLACSPASIKSTSSQVHVMHDVYDITFPTLCRNHVIFIYCTCILDILQSTIPTLLLILSLKRIPSTLPMAKTTFAELLLPLWMMTKRHRFETTWRGMKTVWTRNQKPSLPLLPLNPLQDTKMIMRNCPTYEEFISMLSTFVQLHIYIYP